MNSQKLNDWLTLAANVGVIAGIVILAIEIRQNYEKGMYDESEFELQISTIRADMETFPGLKIHWCNNKYAATKRLVEAIEGDQPSEYC